MVSATTIASCALMLVLQIPSPAKEGNAVRDHRLGFVGMKFDDGSEGHYTNACPIMEKYGIRGIFCVNAGNLAEEPGGTKITAAQCVEMYRAGHEIVDHTLHHESAIWGDAGTVEEWTKRTEESLAIFRRLGIRVRGWNLPGGTGSVYNKALHDLMPKYYEYARGGNCDFGYRHFELCWNFKGDPHGYRGVSGSWESYVDAWGEATRAEATEAVQTLKTTRADAIQRGVYCAFTFHRIIEPNQAKWALEEFCKWIADNNVPCATVGEALDAFRNPRKHYPEDIEQIPCAEFQYDLDGDGRPDGWENCSFAPDEVKSPGGGRVAEFRNGTRTRLFGPEPGNTRVSFAVRSADGTSRSVSLRIGGVEVLENFVRSPQMRLADVRAEAGDAWREMAATFDVSPRMEHCAIDFTVEGDGRVQVTCPSWRRVM